MRVGYARLAGCAGALLSVVMMVSSCSRRKLDFVARVGNDSLTVREVMVTSPDLGAIDTQNISTGIIRLALAQVDTVKPDSTRRAANRALANQLSLLGATQWTDTAAGVLLDAAHVLGGRFRLSRSKAEIAAYVDSLFKAVALIHPAATVGSRVLSASTIPDTINPTSRDKLVALMNVVLGLSDQASGTVAEFLDSPGAPGRTMDMNELVKGLISGPTKPTRTAVARTTEIDRDNSVAAMKYRNQQSIRDSISRHVPNLQELYKKHLKAHEGAGGTVWVALRIDAAGQVIAADLKSSDIRDGRFTGQFLSYVKTIRFQSIPEKVGTMRFEFPFEFTAEMN